MITPFSFLNTDATTPEGKNWRTFDQASKTLTKTDLVFSNPVGATSVVRGVFTQYGPIIFYSIVISVPNGDGWTVTAYIDLPFSADVQNSQFTAPHIGSIFTAVPEAFIGFAYISGVANPNRLNLSAGYTNASGSTEYATITGWFYRGN